MASCVKKLESSPQTPMNNQGESNSEELDGKIVVLMQKLREKGCVLDEGNKQTVVGLIEQKDQITAQYTKCLRERNVVVERAVQLNQELKDSNADLEQSRKEIQSFREGKDDDINNWTAEANRKVNKFLDNWTTNIFRGYGCGACISYLACCSSGGIALFALGGAVLGGYFTSIPE